MCLVLQGDTEAPLCDWDFLFYPSRSVLRGCPEGVSSPQELEWGCPAGQSSSFKMPNGGGDVFCTAFYQQPIGMTEDHGTGWASGRLTEREDAVCFFQRPVWSLCPMSWLPGGNPMPLPILTSCSFSNTLENPTVNELS